MRNGRPPTSHSMHSFLHQYTGSFKKPPLRRPHSVIGGTLGSFMAMPRNGSRLGETHTHLHVYTRKEVSSRRADGIQEQTGNPSQSWYVHPASRTHKPTGSFSLRPQQGCFCPTDSWTGDAVKHGSVSCINWFITLGPYQRVWSRGLEGKTMWGWFRAAADFMLGAEEQWWDDSEYSVTQRNNMWWASECTSLQAFLMFSQESPGRSGVLSARLCSKLT